ncbi:MAG: DUF1835 domain-containing protein [Nannocystales bacterium]
MTEKNDTTAAPFDPQALDPNELERLPQRYAKRLLRDLKASSAPALQALEQFHPRAKSVGSQPKLADAQLVIARILGYDSWPKFRQHRTAMEVAQREIDEGAPAPDHEMETLHVRCGSDIQQALTDAGYSGRFVEFADPYCQGPVPQGSDDVLLQARADFLAHAFELQPKHTLARLHAERQALDRVEETPRAVLWFEHDSYDQLILAAVLDRLRRFDHPCIELICVQRYPGRRRFVGLGELGRLQLRDLWSQRRRVKAEEYELATQVWNALRSEDPRGLWAIAERGTPAIEPMAGAVKRHLMELPWTTDGLSLTQRLTLEVVGAGHGRAGSLFRALRTVEPLPFLGDAMWWWEVRELEAGGALSLTRNDEAWPGWGIALTDLGHGLLENRADWIRESGRTRWLGGVRCGTRGGWRWDPTAHAPVMPDRR